MELISPRTYLSIHLTHVGKVLLLCWGTSTRAMASVSFVIIRNFSSSFCMQGKKTRFPFDYRFEVTGKHANRKKPKHEQTQKLIAKHLVQPNGVINKKTGKFVLIKEMIPEFIVPDLTDCDLKPYVSYKVPDVSQAPLTAKDLFDACYAKKIIEEFNKENKM